MFANKNALRTGLSASLLAVTFLLPIASTAQDLVPISSITGGSSVFVFRNTARAIKRTIVPAKPQRPKTQRLESIVKIKKQYETLAKVAPRRVKAPSVDPVRNPVSKSLPPAQGAMRFAGVGEFYLDKGDIELALAAFRDALELDENNVAARAGYSEALATQGNDLLVKDQANAAKSVFLESLKFNPKNSAAYFGLAESYTELNETAQAIANYEKAIENDKDLTEIYIPLGILYYQTNEIAKADDLLTKAVAKSPNSSEAYFFLGLVRAVQMRDEEALAAFTKAKTLDPTNADAFFNSAETLVRLKRLEASIPDYEKATQLKPSYFDAWFGLGEVYFALGDYPKAVVAYQTASKLKNNDWEVFSGLAESLRLTNEFEKAEGNYRLAGLFLSQKPGYDKKKTAEFSSKIGLMIGQQCDINLQKNIGCNWTPAIKALQKAVDDSQDPIDYVNLGWAYFRAGHRDAENKNLEIARPFLENARDALQKAVAAGPPAENFALQNLASVYIDLGDNKMAIETLNKLIQKQPDLDFARYALGVAYFKSNDFANAEKWFRAAIEKDPKNVVYYMALGNALISRKDGKGLKALIDRLKPIDAGAADELDKKRIAFRM
ncbi:MAG: tetratricopeptide repeat protein [Pyrinomonadaceae bacterium]